MLSPSRRHSVCSHHGLHRFASFALVALLTVMLPRLVHADEGSAQRVEALKQRGNQAMMDLNYADALAAYTAAIAITPDDATLYYNLGRTHQAREDFPAALDALEEFGRRASPEVRARVPKLDQLVDDVRLRVGTIAVRCTEDLASATISVADKAPTTGCSTTPKQIRVSVPSRHAVIEVRLAADAYQAQSARVDVTGGGPAVAVTLTVLRKATSGTLLVRALPANARISVDGVERGNAPLEVPLAVGPHALDVRADNHDPKHVPFLVDAGSRKEVSIELQRSAPLTSKWWFWTGVGVAAVGIGVGVWLLVVQPETSAGKGTIPPQQVSAPLVSF